MRTAARIERIDHPMLDAGGVGECLNCGRVCTVEELLGKACACGAATFTAIPRLTDKINTVAVFDGFPAGTIEMGEEPKQIGPQRYEYNFTHHGRSERRNVPNPNPLTDQIHVAPLREGRKCQRAKRRARYNRPA